jgi:hypothetical protein
VTTLTSYIPIAGSEADIRPSRLAEFPGIENALTRLIAYAEANRWSGYDPYDALNSRWLQKLPLLDRRWMRLMLTQFLKRSPVNLRPILGVPPSENPKALGLFLVACVRLTARNWQGARKNAEYLAERLLALSSKTEMGCGWGYSFPWQTRTVLVPRGTPNLVCTVFVANALLEAFECLGTGKYLQAAASAARYVSEELYWENGQTAGFSYPTRAVRTPVHNANLLGSALLCRVARHEDQFSLMDRALKVAHYTASRQRPDGSWFYGEAPNQGWIDNFHTGFNLSALRVIADCAVTDKFETSIRRGFEFFRNNFFTTKGVARYFCNKTYPIDIHCIAQSLLTLNEFRESDPQVMRLAGQVYRWTMRKLWNDSGFFYYRKLRGLTIRTPYMRWSQAWMALALASVVTSGNEARGRI